MKHGLSLRLALAACLVVSLNLVTEASAATRTWTGTISGAWSNAENWGGALPVAGDDLVFPAGASNTTNINDFPAGTSFSSITVNATYLIGGNAVTLTAASALTFQTAATASVTFNVPVTLTNAAAAIATPQPDPTTLNVTLGPVAISGGALLLPIAGNATQVYFTGPITETAPASITKSGNTVAYFNANNTYSGQTVINQGYLVANASGALGTGTNSAADGTVVNSGGSLSLGTVNIPNEHLVLNGGGQSGNGAFQSGGGAATWGGDIVLNTSGIAMNLLGTSLTINGRITGSGSFQFGRSNVTVTNPLNDYAGATVIGNPSGGSSVLILGASEVIPNGSAVSVLADATLDVNGKNETIGSLSGNGPVDLKNGQIYIDGSASTTFDGIFFGGGAVNKNGPGTLTLNGLSNLSSMAFNLNAGTVIVNGHIGPQVYLGQSTLRGTGGVGFAQAFLNFGATIAPGIAASTGTLGAISLSLPAGNTLAIRLNGTSAGTQYDQLAVSGSPSSSLISLGGTLSVSLGFAPPVGTVFRIIDNLSPGFIGGTFAGLPEGANLVVGSTTLRISYVGGTGNDVTLTVAPAPPVPSITTTSPLPGGTVGTAYSSTIAGSGGTPPYAWSVTNGSLPPGVTLNASTGALSGTPTTAGTFNFTVTLTDNAAQAASTPFALTIAAAPPPVTTQPVPMLGPWSLGLLALLTALGGIFATRKRG